MPYINTVFNLRLIMPASRSLYYALMPLLVLLVAIVVACILSYILVVASNNNLPLANTISKITQLLLVLSIFPAMTWLTIDKSELGFAERKRFIKQLVSGFILGIITLLPVFILLYALGIHIIDDSKIWTVAFLVKKTALALLTALIISLLEEPLFRGMVLIGLQKKISLIAAILLSAFYYAAVHFLQNKTEITASELSLSSSFILATQAVANLLKPSILSAFIALFMVGLFLAIIRLHFPDSLGVCIGCHTSWVWQIKLSKEAFNTDFNAAHAYWVSTYDGVIGSLVTVWLLLAIGLYFKFAKNSTRLKRYFY